MRKLLVGLVVVLLLGVWIHKMTDYGSANNGEMWV